MFTLRSASTFLSLLALFGSTTAHLGAFHKGMYCLDGIGPTINYNSNEIVNPLYQLPFKDWWMHHVDKCDEHPPPKGDFLDLPAGGSFSVEIASNRAKTTLSYGGKDASDWPDGARYPENYNMPKCITEPNMHTQNRSMAAGTAFAISYQSDIKKVTPENLVVFTVRLNTPWKRVTWYDVPAALPACPAEGCICAWGWVPNGCGQPNMYMQPFRCRVTNAKSTTPVGTPKPPVWCEGNPAGCTKGPKQMIYWQQAERNNIAVTGYDLRGAPKSPGYNPKCGFADGAQNDIFVGPPSSGPPANPSPKPSSGKVETTTPPVAAPPAQTAQPANPNPKPGNPNPNPGNGNTGGNGAPAESKAPITSSTIATSPGTPTSISAPAESLPSTGGKPRRKCKNRSRRSVEEASSGHHAYDAQARREEPHSPPETRAMRSHRHLGRSRRAVGSPSW